MMRYLYNPKSGYCAAFDCRTPDEHGNMISAAFIIARTERPELIELPEPQARAIINGTAEPTVSATPPAAAELKKPKLDVKGKLGKADPASADAILANAPESVRGSLAPVFAQLAEADEAGVRELAKPFGVDLPQEGLLPIETLRESAKAGIVATFVKRT
ncbi:MAG: hypothetical protein RLZZ524_2297 [Pseudomonadota bacterium]|jgi:hypothetical protein